MDDKEKGMKAIEGDDMVVKTLTFDGAHNVFVSYPRRGLTVLEVVNALQTLTAQVGMELGQQPKDSQKPTGLKPVN